MFIKVLYSIILVLLGHLCAKQRQYTTSSLIYWLKLLAFLDLKEQYDTTGQKSRKRVNKRKKKLWFMCVCGYHLGNCVVTTHTLYTIVCNGVLHTANLLWNLNIRSNLQNSELCIFHNCLYELQWENVLVIWFFFVLS